MSRVFLSFLGLGSYDAETGTYAYTPAIYSLNDRLSRKTEFVQVAELELLGVSAFDRILIVATRKSYETHFHKLKEVIEENNPGKLESIIISEDMTPKGQWEWFEAILAEVESGDELTIDLTHGYRSIPIVFSAAINFLQKARHIRLKAVYYGAFEMARQEGFAPIFDMKDFYSINEWAEAVSRLVEDADARKMAQVTETTASFQVEELNQPKLVRHFESLTDAIRNVDINFVPEKAASAMALVSGVSAGASETGRLLLGLLEEKFTGLASSANENAEYDRDYFHCQLELSKLLLKHKLFMQAFTVMRELIGSVALIEKEGIKVNSGKSRKLRYRYAGVFVNMLQFDEDKWQFHGDEENWKNELMPFYHKLKAIGVESRLRDLARELIKYRNGFDHGWTGRNGALPDIAHVGALICDNLVSVVSTLHESGLMR